MLRRMHKEETRSSRAVPDSVAENDIAVWKEIPGYEYRYRISDYGVVQRYAEKAGTWRTLSQYKMGGRSRNRVAVKLTVVRGVHKHVFVVDLMAELFMGGRDAHSGMVISHKNGSSSDCSLNNLEWSTLQLVGKKFGDASSRPVEKIDRDGNVVDLFRSNSECCAKEFISRKTLWRIMTGRCRDPFYTTGYTYRYEEGDVHHGQKKAYSRKAHNPVS